MKFHLRTLYQGCRQIFQRQISKLSQVKPKLSAWLDTTRGKWENTFCFVFLFAIWVNLGEKENGERERETSTPKERWPFYRGPSFTKHSIPLRQDWVNVPSLPSHPSPAPPVSQWLAGLIYLMEGILHRALALVVSLYCNLFPPPDVPLSKHGNAHPQIPVQTYQVVATCLRGPWPTEVTGTVTRVLGVGEQTRKREADRKTDRRRCQTYVHASWRHQDDLEE